MTGYTRIMNPSKLVAYITLQRMHILYTHSGVVAQRIGHRTCDEEVPGSTPG